MKRIICLLLIAAMAVAIFAGCSGDTAGGSGGTGISKVGINDVPDLSGVTIRILTNSAFTSGVDYASILARWEQVEERTGVKLIWECIDTDYNTVLNTRLAGDTSTAPDIVMLSGVTEAASYIEDDLLFDLTEAYDYCPNIKAFYTENNTEMADILTYVDGGIYQMACSSYATFEDYLKYTATTIDNHLWYRADIAEALGFTEPPKTLQDWYDMLKAVKKAYPSMYTFDVTSTIGSWSSVNIFASAFGLKMNFENSKNYFYVDDSGKVKFEPESDACKAWLTEMQKWYKEGLFHKSADSSKLYSNAAAGLTFASFFRGLSTHVAALVENNPDIHFEAVSMPSNAGYKTAYGSRNPYGSNTYAIVDNNDKDRCIAVAQFLDYAVYSAYGIASERFGPEGYAWSFDEDYNIVLDKDCPVWSDTNSLHLQGAYMWSKFPSVYSADVNAQYFDMIEKYAETVKRDERLEYIDQAATAATAINMSYAFETFVVPYMEEGDQETVDEILGDLETFTKEMMTAYLLGNKDLSKWDEEFVKPLYDVFRLQELLDIYQEYVDKN